MRTGPIRSESQQLEVDQSNVTHSLWEQSQRPNLSLPWSAASSLSAHDITTLLSSASSAILVVGSGPLGKRLLDLTLDHAPPSCRLYLYGSSHLESDVVLRKRLATLADRVLARLGVDAPAHWLVVDSGRAAILLMGPAVQPRQWMASLDGALSRSLYEASRVLFWFHATREALPDRSGNVAFRSPLPAPFQAPGNDVPLPAGRLVMHGKLSNPIVDAELRIAPDGNAPGRSRVVLVPPDTTDFDTPLSLANAASQVVWVDTGLPHTSVSQERLVVDLVEPPVSLQLEWPKAFAIDMSHRLERAAQQPTWRFFPKRKLADVNGSVLLPNAQGAAEVPAILEVNIPDMVLSPADFDTHTLEVPAGSAPLARKVNYKRNLIPKALPKGAREAEIDRQWRAVDEWARRQVDAQSQALRTMASEEKSVIERLRTWFTGETDMARQRRSLHERLVELGEVKPSSLGREARNQVDQIAACASELQSLLDQGYQARVAAENAAAESAQQSAWETRTRTAREALDTKRAESSALEEQLVSAQARLDEATEALDTLVQTERAKRRAELQQKLEQLTADREAAQNHKASIASQGTKSAAHKEAARKITQIDTRLGRLKDDISGLSKWTPPATMTMDATAAKKSAQDSVQKIQAKLRPIGIEIDRLETLAAEAFQFVTPTLSAAPVALHNAPPPEVPAEALPSIGELFEHEHKRYLAVRTWEQVRAAVPEATRLRAELVVHVQK